MHLGHVCATTWLTKLQNQTNNNAQQTISVIYTDAIFAPWQRLCDKSNQSCKQLITDNKLKSETNKSEQNATKNVVLVLLCTHIIGGCTISGFASLQLKRIVVQDLKSLISSFIFPSGNRELVTLMRNSNDVTRAGERWTKERRAALSKLASPGWAIQHL